MDVAIDMISDRIMRRGNGGCGRQRVEKQGLGDCGVKPRERPRFPWIAFVASAFFSVIIFGWPNLASAQNPMLVPPAETSATPPIIDDLSPEQIDGLLSQLTDKEVRDLLRGELVRRYEAESRDLASADPTLDRIGTRLADMEATIRARILRWSDALATLDQRLPEVERRLADASRGVSGMVIAALALVAIGLGAAYMASLATRPWRRWLLEAAERLYWDSVLRTVALAVIEFLPVIAFVATTRIAAPFLAGPLGPLNGQVWIYHAGVAFGWACLLIVRRAFAPDAPGIRIAPLSDDAATGLYRVLRFAIAIGVTGWLIAGFLLNLGLGFPPAIVTVALSGTSVALLLLIALIRNLQAIRKALAKALGVDRDRSGAQDSNAPGALLPELVVASGPIILGIYLVGAWAFWLAHWLERGQHQLGGPLGTLVVLLILPILDRMAGEIVRSALRSEGAAAVRFRRVLHIGLRTIIGFGAVLAIASLWDLNLLDLAKGDDAPLWANAAFDIAITLLIGQFLWRLISVALHTEKRANAGAEDVELDSDEPSTSRLETLTPLFRNMLLGILAIVVLMILLADLGVDVGPLIASAGIVGIAVGFGAQTLVRDIFSGIFFLIDDAFRIGEYIELDADLRGEVETISIRSLQLRHHRGPVITIPFGELKQITNHTRDWVIYKMSFRLEPETDPQRVKKIVKAVGQELLDHPEHGPKFIEPLKSQGVYFIDDDSALVIRVKFKCRPRAQFVLRREIYHRLRTAFAEQGIIFARRKVEVVGPDGQALPDPQRAALPEEVLSTTPSSL